VPATTTPNGVDLDRFTPDLRVRREMREREGLGDDDLVALFVGGDWARKGLDQAVRGLAVAQRAVERRLTLWVVGKGDERRLRRLAASCGVDGQVRFFGFRADVEPFYQAADLFVFPTLYEAFPLVSLEAAACGLPIVAPAVSGIDQLVGNDEGGLLVDRSPEAIGAAIASLASDAALRVRLGEAARQRASQYSWDRSVASVVETYRRLLGERRADRELAVVPQGEGSG
jgi:UDP-glucose:(heptosyl)LPS alpha-1,3-glucosyltransferase